MSRSPALGAAGWQGRRRTQKQGVYNGPALFGVDEKAVSTGRFPIYDAAVTAAGGKLNLIRIYRQVLQGGQKGTHNLNQITANDVAHHNAGRLLDHSLRTDNVYDVDTTPGGTGQAVSAWRGVTLGLHNAVLDAFLNGVRGLDFSPGKPQYVKFSLDPETSRFVNGASGSADHGTAAEYLAAHAYVRNYLKSSDMGSRILVGWCDQWYWFKFHPDAVAAVCPPDDQVDVALMDLTYNKPSSQPTWMEASGFFADFLAWCAKYGKLLGKQYMCQEGDCAPWYTTYTTSSGATKVFPTGAVGPDTTRRKNYLRNLGQYIHDNPLCIGHAHWDDEYPLNDQDSIDGFAQGAALAQAA